MSEGTPPVPAGWYADPETPNQHRYWDGMRWTEHVQPLADAPPPLAPAPLAPAPGPLGAPTGIPPGPLGAQPRSGMSTGLKVLLVLVGVGVVLLGGCTALLVAASRGIEEAVDHTNQELQATPEEAEAGVADGSAAGSDGAATGAGGGEGFGSREDPLPFSQPVELEWRTLGDADGSRWSTTIGPLADITDAVLAENQFNEPPPEGVRMSVVLAIVALPMEAG